MSSLDLRLVECRTILNRTGGFLHAFSHSLNPYRGCTYGRTLCGVACYAPAVLIGRRKPSEWGGYLEAKTNAAEAYARDIRRERRRGPVRVFCASVTDPYVPQERRLKITRRLLQAIADDPPDRLVLQTHTPGPLRDLDLLRAIDPDRCDLSVQISIETDRASIPGLPPHSYPPEVRLDALRRVKDAGLEAVGVVAPLLPLADPESFAHSLAECCTRIIVDHYLVGDGSKGGTRTQRRGLPSVLRNAGFEPWTHIEALHETVALFQSVLGKDRVNVSTYGFNR